MMRFVDPGAAGDTSLIVRRAPGTVVHVRAVTDESFDDDVLRAPRPVVVDFWAPSCVPCRAIESTLVELAATSDRVEFVKLDVDDNPRTAARYDVLSLPTVILFAGGDARETVHGSRSKRHFERAFAAYL